MPEVSSQGKSVLVLGAGYVGRAIVENCSSRYLLKLTSRAGRKEGWGTVDDPSCFELMRRETWGIVDAHDCIVWTFPAARSFDEIPLAVEFFQFVQRNSSGRIKPVLVLASTSCYRTTVADELVDEKAELDSTQSRVVAEEKLRSLGATVLCLAGLYGGSRDPVQWLVNGLVKNSRAYINLVHKSDVVKIAEAWVESQLPGERINASDGRHRRWSEMLDCMKSFGVVPSDMQPFVEELENVSSKRVCNSKLVSLLYAGPFHRYPEDGL